MLNSQIIRGSTSVCEATQYNAKQMKFAFTPTQLWTYTESNCMWLI